MLSFSSVQLHGTSFPVAARHKNLPANVGDPISSDDPIMLSRNLVSAGSTLVAAGNCGSKTLRRPPKASTTAARRPHSAANSRGIAPAGPQHKGSVLSPPLNSAFLPLSYFTDPVSNSQVTHMSTVKTVRLDATIVPHEREMKVRGRAAIGAPTAAGSNRVVAHAKDAPPERSNMVTLGGRGDLLTRPSSFHGSRPPAVGTISSGSPGGGMSQGRPVTSSASDQRQRFSFEHATDHQSSSEPNDDGICFAHGRDDPSTLVVCRRGNSENPERLNLDRRQLTACPVLENESRLRLLNYQNNYISKIGNLDNLPHLIFLDLYNNNVEHLSDALSPLTALRVLMLGKNRIKQISNLEKLSKLDVLDLHSNHISKLENLESLTELRVLNLAGNQISVVEGLSALRSLTELNLRRNQIERVIDLHPLPLLQRVFMSNNCVPNLEAVDSLLKVRYLVEVALDGNPVATENCATYRRCVIDRVKTLRQLDLKRITEEERKQAGIDRRREESARKLSEAEARADASRKSRDADDGQKRLVVKLGGAGEGPTVAAMESTAALVEHESAQRRLARSDVLCGVELQQNEVEHEGFCREPEQDTAVVDDAAHTTSSQLFQSAHPTVGPNSQGGACKRMLTDAEALKIFEETWPRCLDRFIQSVLESVQNEGELIKTFFGE